MDENKTKNYNYKKIIIITIGILIHIAYILLASGLIMMAFSLKGFAGGIVAIGLAIGVYCVITIGILVDFDII